MQARMAGFSLLLSVLTIDRYQHDKHGCENKGPQNSRKRRPIRSTIGIATIVETKFQDPIMIALTREESGIFTAVKKEPAKRITALIPVNCWRNGRMIEMARHRR